MATTLSSLSDEAVRDLLDAGTQPRTSIGGSTRTIEVSGMPVFVKAITLSDREVDAGPGDTRNLFDLPPWYHYGVGKGSTGFNAWREVALHEMASDWVLNGASPGFPLLYHWRLLPDVPSALREASIGPMLAFWAGSPQIEERLRALATARTAAVLFIEHLPWTLRHYLDRQSRSVSAQEQAASFERVLNHLLGAVAQMQAHGVVHFDAHLDNVVTTGRQLVVTDFGLAAAASFHLDSTEREFLTAHTDHDVAYCIASLTNSVLKFPDARARNDWLRRCAQTGAADGLPKHLVEIVRRLAPAASAMNDFYWDLHDGRLEMQFPSAEIATTLAGIGKDQLW
ncbi:hypothetical protein JRC04_15240 [Mycolicibacterium sp. S2-37]|uniref:phosphotransferase n=1 Tax=Mycolicibacterium sp. S2-37 TaxID=2810297 RepID=UPI001A93E86D|nr:phosphotransferase [Mycolicibacterium sp. S2-37]MBO0678820.1 hypothetical protein [Mycolicibacterium sp. S2-37]